MNVGWNLDKIIFGNFYVIFSSYYLIFLVYQKIYMDNVVLCVILCFEVYVDL